MNKNRLTEQVIRTQYITPAIKGVGWIAPQIREEYAITKGRIIARGGCYKHKEVKRSDYILLYIPHIPLAIVEASIMGSAMRKCIDNKGEGIP